MKKELLCCAAALFFYGTAQADVTVPMNLVDAKGVGQNVGQVVLSDSPFGLVATPALKDLVPGLHGFHVHENPSCEAKKKEGIIVPALAAGGHYDPKDTKSHGTPWGEGHLGDMPALYADKDGKAITPVLAPRLKVEDVKGRSLMIHLGSDNYSDTPAPLGGGGSRVVCGVIP